MMARIRPKRTLLYYVTEAFVIYLLVTAGMYLLQGSLLFHPDTKIRRTPSTLLRLDYENLMLEVQGHKTNGWYIPLENARGTVLFSHGNDGNMSGWQAFAPAFRSLGFSVLLYDYGGFGNSTGRPTETRCHADAMAMWKWLTETKGIPPEKILVYGQSLGGGVAAHLAAEVKPGAVVLESTFTSVADLAAQTLPIFPVRWLCKHPFDSAARMASIHAPVMIIHSKEDRLVPIAHARKLLELANEPKTWLEIRGDHTNAFMHSKKTVLEGLRKLIDPLFPETPRP
jgi:fermentation-respiration switch protein FrsA (DUF1100 family)